MGCICFVILHYNGIEDTEKCIQSIKELEGRQDIRIVIVDNASPNGTGQLLSHKYAHNKTIDIVLKKENDGFSRGNNAGCAYALTKWDPDFLVVANNDVIFAQEEFTTLIRETYEKEPFAVLGPDIYDPERQIHQSPISDTLPDTGQVGRTIFLNRVVLGAFSLFYPVMKRYFQNLEVKAGLSYDRNWDDVCVMGACLVFSREYFQDRDKVFAPETRFYYEENIMLLWCRQHHKIVRYRPALQVMHMEGRATETVDADNRKKIKFRMKNIVDSAGIYRNYLLREKRAGCLQDRDEAMSRMKDGA